LVTTMVSVEVPPDAMDVGAKLFVTVGGAKMFSVALAAAALLPPEVCSALAAMVFVAAPAVDDVTFTITVQPPAGIEVPLATVTLPAPAAAVTPAHVPVLPAVPMVMPAGSVSVSALVSVSAEAFVLPMVMVRLVLPPRARLATPKAFETVGVPSTVSTTPVAAVPVSATGPVAAGAVVALVFVLVAVTDCVMVQLPPGSNVAALKPTLVPLLAPPVSVALLPAVQETLPAPLFASVPVKASLIVTPVRLPGFAAGFVTTIVSVEVPPEAMDVGAKLFETVGGA